MSELGPCTSCRRHVRVDARSCPFCGEELTLEYVAPSGLARMSRAAMLAGAVVAVGCHSPPQTIYGGPPSPEPVTDAAAPAPSGSAAPVTPPAAIYGAPPPAPSDVPK